MSNSNRRLLVNGVTMADAEEFLTMEMSTSRPPYRQPYSTPYAFYQTPPPLVYPTIIRPQQQPQQLDFRTYIQQITAPPMRYYSTMSGNQYVNAQPPTEAVNMDNFPPTRPAGNIFGMYTKQVENGDQNGQKNATVNEEKQPPPQHLTGQNAMPFGYYCYQQQQPTMGQYQHTEMWNGGTAEEFSQNGRENASSRAKIQQQNGKNYSTTFYNPNDQWPIDDTGLSKAINTGTRARHLNTPKIAFQKPNQNKSMKTVNKRKRKVDSEQPPGKRARDQLLIEEDGHVYASL